MGARLTLTVLIDNATLTDRYFTAEPGLSFHIETVRKKILFDKGIPACSWTTPGRWESISMISIS